MNTEYLFFDDMHYDKADEKDKSAMAVGAFDKMKSRFDNLFCAPIFPMRISVIKEIKQVISRTCNNYFMGRRHENRCQM